MQTQLNPYNEKSNKVKPTLHFINLCQQIARAHKSVGVSILTNEIINKRVFVSQSLQMK